MVVHTYHWVTYNNNNNNNKADRGREGREKAQMRLFQLKKKGKKYDSRWEGAVGGLWTRFGAEVG
jgi:hypothetical protein